MKFFIYITLVLAAGAKSNKNKKSKASQEYSKLENRVKQEKLRVRSVYCPEIEDEKLLFNCVSYNLSPTCFINTFGDRGIELGEITTPKQEKDFNTCWKRERDLFDPKLEELASKSDIPPI